MGAGDDVVNSGLGTDYVDGGGGNDVLILDFSVMDTPDVSGVKGGGAGIYGGPFYRTLIADGTRIDNISFRNIESMVITGTSKDDFISGSFGSDKLYGGLGNDTLDGSSSGNDYIEGGAGNDTITGSYGAYGNGSADTLIGGSGDDTLKGLTGDDKLVGGTGNDTLIADFQFTYGFGNDSLSGGDGNDVIREINFNGGYAYALAGDRLHLDGGAGTDMLSADFSNETQAITFTDGLSNSLDFADGSYFRNFERIGDFIAGSGNDVLTLAGRADNNISLLDGNDTINPGLGIDYVYGGFGDDTLILDYSLGDGANVGGVVNEGPYLVRRDLITNAVIDMIYAGEFEHFQITGGSKAELLVGGGGNDILNGGGGADTLRGGAGPDVMNGGAGNDTVDYGDTFVTVVATLTGSTVSTVLVGGNAGDQIRNFENIIGGYGYDQLTGDGSVNVMDGGAGNDILNGGAGADRMTGGTGNDTFYVDIAGDKAFELLNGGTDVVLSGVSFALAKDQEIEALRAADINATAAINLTGNAFGQTIEGNAGANTLSGGGGNDTLQGHGGADSFTFDAQNGGVDTILDFVAADDTIRVSASAFGGGLVAGQSVGLATTADFTTVSSGAPRFIYDTAGPDAGLYFDATGGSGADAVLFAVLTGTPTLKAIDIVIF